MSHLDTHSDHRRNRPERPRGAWSLVVLALFVPMLLGGCGGQAAAGAGGAPPAVAPDPAGDATPDPEPSSVAPPAITYPRAGSERWAIAPGRGPVAGSRGRFLRYRVSVEKDIRGVSARAFAEAVEATLGNRRSWAASGEARLQRVGPHSAYDFTVYLATPATRDQLCGDAAAGEVDRYTSCRNGDAVVLNVARWARGVPHYGASLAVYRTYMVNHEVGHELGFHHEKCPGAGETAPVMQQQTLGLHGCRPNGWPNRKNGTQYHGPPGAYGDQVPRAG